MRTIDRILKLVDEMTELSPVERQVLRTRIESEPTNAEITEARRQIDPYEVPHAWTNVVHPPS